MEAIAKLSMEFRNMDLNKNIIKNILYQKTTTNHQIIDVIVNAVHAPNVPKNGIQILIERIFYKNCID